MLSLGTELLFAFWMASARVGLPAGSPPPVRAATSTFLMSFANSLPRRASTTAFLCFVVAHFEWPLTRPPSHPPPDSGAGQTRSSFPDHRDEQPVDPQVAGQLGMERRRQQRTLSYGDDPTGGLAVLDARERLDAVTHRLDPWCADEHGMHRFVQPRESDVAFEGVDLPAESVAANGHVQPAD